MLEAGSKLGPYEIRSHLGAGGMGEVYLAHDRRLERTVALKVLPPGLASDQQRMNRFTQEAKTTSSLNHPNLITIYEISQEGPLNYIATEFVDRHHAAGTHAKTSLTVRGSPSQPKSVKLWLQHEAGVSSISSLKTSCSGGVIKL